MDLQQTRAAGVWNEEVREGHGEGVREREGPDPEVDAEHGLDRVVDLDRQEGAGEADAVHQGRPQRLDVWGEEFPHN